MTRATRYTPSPSAEGERLDRWLAAELGISRSQAERLIDRGAVTVDGKKPRKAGDRLKGGELVEVHDLPEQVTAAVIEKTVDLGKLQEISVVAETADYTVIEKPAGLVVHPPAGVEDQRSVAATATVAGWVLGRYPELWGVGEYANRPGMPHRLDKDTSGLMVIAKNQKMFRSLKRQFKDRKVEKYYYALAHGVIEADTGRIDFPIDRGVDGRMVARPRIEAVTLRNVSSLQPGRGAITEFSVLERFVNFTFLDVRLHTGRTHQIRVHFYAYNHPLVGDTLYFNKKQKRDKDEALGRVFLHSHRLSFADLAKAQVSFESPLPEELGTFLRTLTK